MVETDWKIDCIVDSWIINITFSLIIRVNFLPDILIWSAANCQHGVLFTHEEFIEWYWQFHRLYFFSQYLLLSGSSFWLLSALSRHSVKLRTEPKIFRLEDMRMGACWTAGWQESGVESEHQSITEINCHITPSLFLHEDILCYYFSYAPAKT